MAALGTYNTGILNDNWYEDRHQKTECLSATSQLNQRTPRSYETDIAYIGDRYDVLTRISRMPPRESYAAPDDGFREKDRTSSVDYAPPNTRKEFIKNPPEKLRLLSLESVPEVSFDDRRPVPGSARGFGAVLNRHDETHDIRYWNTTHGDFFGEGSRRATPRLRVHEGVIDAGFSSAAEDGRTQGLKVGTLCGEHYTDHPEDPAGDTKTQRAWLYQADSSLENIHLGGLRPKISKTDNALSLPIGDGAMAKVRQDLKERKGRLYRTATHITKAIRPGVSVFQDG